MLALDSIAGGTPDGELPVDGSTARLERNLRALAQVDAALAERLRLPVESDHVRFDSEGRAFLRLHRDLVPLEPPLDAPLPAGEVLLLGVGTGELLAALLARGAGARVVAWERDPWLLRVSLMRHDWAEALERGILVLRLGADLVLEARRAGRPPLVAHPLLGDLYARERRLYQDGAPHPTALLAEGGLFVEALGRALEARGYSLMTVELERVAEEELDHAVRMVEPEFLALVNYVEGAAEFCGARDLPLVCWEIDPRTHDARPPRTPTDHVGIFTWRRASLEGWRRSGFSRVHHLPLASDPAERFPVELSAADLARYGAPCALVGSSMVAEARRYRALVHELLRAWRGGDARCEGPDQEALDRALAVQRADGSRWRVPELLAEFLPGFLEAARELSGDHDPLLLVGEIAAAEKRLTYAANLGCLGLRAWGDEGWRAIEAHGVRYMGPAGHRRELNRVYCGAAVNVDVGRIYQQDIVTMRVFDVLACGGFVLAEHSAELAELFEVGREVESYTTLEELCAKTAHYLAHPGRARAIAERGRAAILERHRVDQRVATMLEHLPAPIAERRTASRS